MEGHVLGDHLEYNQITEYIYIGTNQCCQINVAQELLQEGIRAIISLEEDRSDTPFGVDYYLWLPTTNDTAPTQQQLQVGSDFISQLVQLKQKVYVHCMLGHGRAPTLVVAYLISTGLTVEQAISQVVARRPVVHLNDAQMRALNEFADLARS